MQHHMPCRLSKGEQPVMDLLVGVCGQGDPAMALFRYQDDLLVAD